MRETISIMFDENGIAKEYDDTFDITIHCESEEEQNKVLEILNREEKTGHWEYVQYDGNPNIGNLHCSECDRIAGLEYKYCPNCGARMVSE